MTERNGVVGKRTLITGAASGIGRAVAIRFAAEGARVALLDRNRGNLEAVAGEIKASEGESLAIPTDVSVEADVAAAVDQVVAAWGGLDAVIGVAGIELVETNVHELDLSEGSTSNRVTR